MENSLTIWAHSPYTKLCAWKNLREDISALSPADALNLTSAWWQSSSAVRRTFDPWKIDKWPNPWNLLYQSEQCPNSIILGIYYTLALTNLNFYKLAVINDIEQRHNCLALIVDDTTVITYNKTMCSTDTELVEILNIFTHADLAQLI